ncbi:uncharacterized protein [Rutidosis leptorrhynchoides]|uniref:uncharacterized protein n=1 Tax=Rutidosis leptorrhynchoides TaxID=125765 RepID=UPI003A9A42C7
MVVKVSASTFFSKCVNLKDLTLHGIEMRDLEELTLCLPQLSNLSVTNSFCNVLNVVTPQLQNLTASFDSIHGLYCREGFSYLEKVHLSWFNTYFCVGKERHLSKIIGVLQKFHTAKFLILDASIIKALSSCVDQLLLEPCPFNNLKCLKMNTMLVTRSHVVVPVQLKNYFLDKSPTATFITDYPQVPQKRSSQQVYDDDDAGAKKMAKLDLQKQPAADTTIITQENELLDANLQMQDQVISKQEAMLEAKIQMQEQAITKQKAMFEAKMQMQDQVITKQKEMFEAKIQMLDNVIAEQKAKIQMQDNVIAEQKERIHMVEVAKLDHDKLISYVIKSKIAELKVQVESGNPDYEVIRSIGSEIKSIMELIPDSLRPVMDAQFCFEYVKWKSLFLTHIDVSQWSKIETELGIINGV